MNTYSLIPQVSIQETLIVEGTGNVVSQNLNQALVFVPIGIPDFNNNEVCQDDLAKLFADIGNFPSLEKTLDQTVLKLVQFGENEDHEDETQVDLTVEFLEDSNLAATQLSLQTVDLLGNDNTVVQQSEQLITDQLIYEREESGNLEDFFEVAAEDLLLDAVQLAFQDVVIEGDNNLVEQSIDQTIVAFVFLEEKEIESNTTLNQVSIQETFLGNEIATISDNSINQAANQLITIDLDFDNEFKELFSIKAEEKDTVSELEINTLVDDSLGKNFLDLGTQENSQDVFITGNNNRVIQENVQTINRGFPSEKINNFFEDILLGSLDEAFNRAGKGFPIKYFFGDSDDGKLTLKWKKYLFGNNNNDTLELIKNFGKNYFDDFLEDDSFFFDFDDRAFNSLGNNGFLAKAGEDPFDLDKWDYDEIMEMNE